MKILHIISSGGIYGAEAVILNLARTMRGGSHICAMAVFANAKNLNLQFYECARKEGFETHWIECAGQMDRSAISRIRKLLNITKADIIHAHGYKADIYCYIALRGTGIPLVSTCHTWYDTDLFVFLYGKLDRFVLRKYTRVVAVSDEVKQRLLQAGVRAEKICTVRNGIDLRPFDKISREPDERNPVVGLVGRLAWEKGVDLFLRAAAKVLLEAPNAEFVVVGEGPDREKLEQLIDELNIRSNTKLLGRCEEMASVYASFDLLVSSSRQEGLPMAILEGMASGLAVVATAVGEVPTIVVNGRTGVLLPAENVDRIAAGIIELLRNPTRRRELGAAARRLVEEEYSAERMTADYLLVYDEAIAAARGESK